MPSQTLVGRADTASTPAADARYFTMQQSRRAYSLFDIYRTSPSIQHIHRKGIYIIHPSNQVPAYEMFSRRLDVEPFPGPGTVGAGITDGNRSSGPIAHVSSISPLLSDASCCRLLNMTRVSNITVEIVIYDSSFHRYGGCNVYVYMCSRSVC